jgi:hypothetical protein
VIREPGLGPAGRVAVAEAASDHDTLEGMDE